MNCACRLIATTLLTLLVCGGSHAAQSRTPAEPKPLVVAVSPAPGSAFGREVVIRPDVAKLKALGLTYEEFAKELRGRRWIGREWKIKIGDNVVNLADVARLELRDVQTQPFTVKLRDGREVLITPDPKKVARYIVTGEEFETLVRHDLFDCTIDPAKYTVLSMIQVPGNVGGYFIEEGTHRHFSLGEPLETFAKVEVR